MTIFRLWKKEHINWCPFVRQKHGLIQAEGIIRVIGIRIDGRKLEENAQLETISHHRPFSVEYETRLPINSSLLTGDLIRL